MRRYHLGWVLAVSFILALNMVQQVIAAQSAIPVPLKKTAAAPQAPKAQSETKPAQSEARVEGFRSARFGMMEAQVLKAIQTDFQINKDAVVREVSALEKTTSLSITVPDLIPGSGPGQVAYIFGYESKKLVQVNLFWGKPVNPNPDASALITAATLLRNYFTQQSFHKDKVVMNGRLEDGTLLVFRATDEKGRMVLLLLNIPQESNDPDAPKTQEKAVPVQDPSLRLSYIENINSPDIFKIKEGHF